MATTPTNDPLLRRKRWLNELCHLLEHCTEYCDAPLGPILAEPDWIEDVVRFDVQGQRDDQDCWRLTATPLISGRQFDFDALRFLKKFNQDMGDINNFSFQDGENGHPALWIYGSTQGYTFCLKVVLAHRQAPEQHQTTMPSSN